LDDWRVKNGQGQQEWRLTSQDGVVQPGQTLIVIRRGRSMSLRNTGDAIVLVSPTGQTVDTKSYGQASSGMVFRFD
jgi:hypothetical protein